MKKDLLYPDYDNCIANIPATILRYFGKNCRLKALPELEKTLAAHEYKNIFVMLFDAMGMAVLERNLPADSFLRRHIRRELTSVYPPTTAAAVTAVCSGLTPLESGWPGWCVWLKEYQRAVVLFNNTDFYNGEKIEDLNVYGDVLPYPHINEVLKDRRKTYFVSKYDEKKGISRQTENLEQWFDELKKLSRDEEKKFVYAYWAYPDSAMHCCGVDAQESRTVLEEINRRCEQLATEMGDDTLLIITADHGMLDVDTVWLNDYPQLLDCLALPPSVEPRFMALTFKPGREEEFTNEFNRLFANDYILMSRDEVIESGLIGTGAPHPRIKEFLGDKSAIAVGNKIIVFHKPDCPKPRSYKAHHAGLTADEMRVPLILIDKK